MSDPLSPVRIRGSRAARICFHCRNRKVRCDGNVRGCENCRRLQFSCSFLETIGTQASNFNTTRQQNEPDFQGIERKRSRRACIQCHKQKARCTAELPSCERCRTRGSRCEYKEPTVKTLQRRSAISQRLNGNANNFSPPRSGSLDSSISQSVPTDEDVFMDGGVAGQAPAEETHLPNADIATLKKEINPAKVIIEKHIDAFFEFIYPIPGYSFLHRAIFLQNWANGSHSPILLQAVCGAAARFISPQADKKHHGALWIDQAESQILRNFANPTISIIEALIIVLFDRTACRKFGNMMALSALVARFAFALRLNYEERRLTFVAQERRRRIMWSIFILNSFWANGRTAFSLCSKEAMHIQLPCHETSFALDIPGETEMLDIDILSHIPLTGGLMAHLVRGLELRVRVLQLTYRILDENNISKNMHEDIKNIDEELQQVDRLRPVMYKFDERNLYFRAHTPQRTGFVMLHLWWHQCFCDLYRFAIPGYREALPVEVLELLPADFTTKCRQSALEHAIATSNIFSSIINLGGDIFVSDSALAMCAFQSARIIWHLGRLAPSRLSTTDLISKIQACSDILKRSSHLYPTSKLMQDNINRLIHDASQSQSPSSPQSIQARSGEQLRMQMNTQSPSESGTKHARSPPRPVYSEHSFLDELQKIDNNEAEERIPDTATDNTASSYLQDTTENTGRLGQDLSGPSIFQQSPGSSQGILQENSVELDYDMALMMEPYQMFGSDDQFAQFSDPYLGIQNSWEATGY